MQHLSVSLSRQDILFLKKKKRMERLTKRVRDRIDILLYAHRGKNVEDIADLLDICPDTVWRIRKRYLDEGAEAALGEKFRPGQPIKYTITHETELTALACSDAPEGTERWTLSLLATRMRRAVKGCRRINRESIRLMLKKTGVSLG